MAWASSFTSKTSSAKSNGACYCLYYRTNPYAAAGQAQLECYVLVDDTGNKFTERWNCKVTLTVDDEQIVGRSHTIDYIGEGDNENANKYSTTDKSGYYKGWKCIANKVFTKSSTSGSVSWKISLVGGFAWITDTTCKIKEFEVSANTYTVVNKGKTEITDNGNNTFTITATAGTKGTNNAVTGLRNLVWSYDAVSYKTYHADTTKQSVSVTEDLEINGNAATRTVYAKSSTAGTYGNPVESTTSKAIRQYKGPNTINTKTNPITLSYSKNRLTMKENWTLSWTAPSINNSCPIMGYRIRMHRKRGANGTYKQLPIYVSSGALTDVTKDTTKNPAHYYKMMDLSTATIEPEKTKSSIVIYPEYYVAANMSAAAIAEGLDIRPGDYVRFSVQAYSKNGKAEVIFNSSAAEAYSAEYLVQNAGIVHVRHNNLWKEGQVYVYMNGGWKEAETVNVMSGSSWKESE